MNRATRLSLATMLTIVPLTVVAITRAQTHTAGSGGRDLRPVLLTFTDTANCPPCRYFDRDYGNSPTFRRALCSRFRVYPSYSPQKYAHLFRKHRVDTTPTWIVLDADGNELNRVTVYHELNTLWKELTTKCENGVCRPIGLAESQQERPNTVPRSPLAPTVPTPPAANPDTRLQAANRKLEQERDGLRNQIYGLRDQLVTAGKDKANFQRQLEQLQSQLRTLQESPTRPSHELNRTTDETNRPPDETIRRAPVQTPGPATDISTEITPSADATRSRLPGILRTGVQIAQAAGLSLPAAETVVALTGIGGPAGAAVAVGLMLLRRRRKRKAAEQADDFHRQHDDTMPLPRDLDEARELLRLRQREGRHAIHDGLFGALAEAELEKLVEAGDPTALKLRDTLHTRMNTIAPLSTKT